MRNNNFNNENEFIYSLIFMNNILICYKNINQVLEQVGVVLQYTFLGIYHKSIYE